MVLERFLKTRRTGVCAFDTRRKHQNRRMSLPDDRPTRGDLVHYRIVSRQPWGVLVRVFEWPGWVASIDLMNSCNRYAEPLLVSDTETGSAVVHSVYEGGSGKTCVRLSVGDPRADEYRTTSWIRYDSD